MSIAIPPELLAKRHLAAGIPRKYLGLRLGQWRPYNNASARALQAAHEFVETFPERYNRQPVPTSPALVGKGLALVGPPGAGKTTLAAAIAAEVDQVHRCGVFFVSLADYINRLLDQISISRQADSGVPQAVERFWKIDAFKRRVNRSPLLVVDDVGKEHHTASQFAQDETDRLLRGRFRNGFPTVPTTNHALEKWGDLYNPSMGSFVLEAFTEIPLAGKDLRRG